MTPRFTAVNVDCNFSYEYERERLARHGIALLERKVVIEDEIIRACADADAMIVEGSKTPMTARVIGSFARCRVIVKMAVGVDNIDLAAATNAGVVVANAADYCTEEVSDHAVALLLASSRRIVAMDRHVRSGGWAGFTRTHPLRRVSRLTLGFVGMGRIAQATARKMAGFGARMIAADPFLPGSVSIPGVEMMALEKVLREADLISVHVPLSPDTRGMIGEAAFRAMKPTAVLVNTSRGPVVDQSALILALRENRIGGAALDVVEEEPLPAGSPLREFPNVILTPHTGADSVDSLQHARGTVVDSVAAVVGGHWPPFPVNAKVTPRQPLAPWANFQVP